MCKDLEQNLAKSLEFCDRAAGSDLLFFPEIQLSPFFPRYKGLNGAQYLLTLIARFLLSRQTKKDVHLYFSMEMNARFEPDIFNLFYRTVWHSHLHGAAGPLPKVEYDPSVHRQHPERPSGQPR